MPRDQYFDSGSFGRRLRAARKTAGLTLQSVADALNRDYGTNINKGTISKYENGIHEPNATTVYCLAQLLKVSHDYLMGKPAQQISSQTTEAALQYKVADNSMAPRYLPDDILLIQPWSESVNGLPCLVEITGSAPIVRKVIINKTGWHLNPLNPEYPSHFLPHNLADNCETVPGSDRDHQETTASVARSAESGDETARPLAHGEQASSAALPAQLTIHGVVAEIRRREVLKPE